MKDEFSSPSLLLLTVRSFQCSGIGTKHLHHFIIELFQLTNSRALNDDVILPTLDANTNQICDFFFSLIFLLRLSHLLFVLPHAALHKFNKQKYKTKQKIKQDLTSPKVKTWWRFARKNSLVIHRFPFCVSYLFACFAYHSFEMINICLCFVWGFFFL